MTLEERMVLKQARKMGEGRIRGVLFEYEEVDATDGSGKIEIFTFWASTPMPNIHIGEGTVSGKWQTIDKQEVLDQFLGRRL